MLAPCFLMHLLYTDGLLQMLACVAYDFNVMLLLHFTCRMHSVRRSQVRMESDSGGDVAGLPSDCTKCFRGKSVIIVYYYT